MDPETLKGVIYGLFRTGRDKLRVTVETHLAPDILVTNPLFSLRGRDTFYNFLRLVTIIFDDQIIVQELAISGNTALMYNKHQFALRAWPFLSISFPINAIVRFTESRTIAEIHDHVSLYTLIWNVPIFGFIWDAFLKQGVGALLALTGTGMDALLEQAKNILDWKDLDI